MLGGQLATLAAYDYTIVYRKGASNGKPDALSRRRDYIPPPLPSLLILPTPPSIPPLFHTPPLVGAVVLVSPDDPLFQRWPRLRMRMLPFLQSSAHLEEGLTGSRTLNCHGATHRAG